MNFYIYRLKKELNILKNKKEQLKMQSFDICFRVGV